MTAHRVQHAGHRVDHASPWVVDTRALGRRPGVQRRFELTAPAVADTGTPMLAVPAGAPVRVAGRLESVVEGVLVTATAAATAVGQCARCLDAVEIPVTAQVQELFAFADSTTAATTDDDEIPRVVEEAVDLAETVHDELVLALPLAPVCRPDCPGLCPICGLRLAEAEAGHSHETIDPRWAALADRVGPSGPSGR